MSDVDWDEDIGAGHAQNGRNNVDQIGIESDDDDFRSIPEVKRGGDWGILSPISRASSVSSFGGHEVDHCEIVEQFGVPKEDDNETIKSEASADCTSTCSRGKPNEFAGERGSVRGFRRSIAGGRGNESVNESRNHSEAGGSLKKFSELNLHGRSGANHRSQSGSGKGMERGNNAENVEDAWEEVFPAATAEAPKPPEDDAWEEIRPGATAEAPKPAEDDAWEEILPGATAEAPKPPEDDWEDEVQTETVNNSGKRAPHVREMDSSRRKPENKPTVVPKSNEQDGWEEELNGGSSGVASKPYESKPAAQSIRNKSYSNRGTNQRTGNFDRNGSKSRPNNNFRADSRSKWDPEVAGDDDAWGTDAAGSTDRNQHSNSGFRPSSSQQAENGHNNRGDWNNRNRGQGGFSGRSEENGSRNGRRYNKSSVAGSQAGTENTENGSSTSTFKTRRSAVSYIPDPLPEGDEVFCERDEFYEGVGEHFDELGEVGVSATENYAGVQPISSFDDMNLPPAIFENLKRLKYSKPTPVQIYGSSVIDAKKDLMACAQNGTGKTAGFLLPILKGIFNKKTLMAIGGGGQKSLPCCLIVAPTRELAIQIAKEANIYACGTGIKTLCVYGGTCASTMMNQLAGGCHIVVATPGRLMQAIDEGKIGLDRVKYFVLDEADRMLDMGFMPDVNKIVEFLPPKDKRISAMFSATFPEPIQTVAFEFLNNYVFVIIGILGCPTQEVTQELIEITREKKTEKLLEILQGIDPEEKAVVFCATRLGTDFLATKLSKEEISATSIHGDRHQHQRELALKEFFTGKRRVLVATDVASRGLDIPKVSLVINYDLPDSIEDYVHRIGRTGRIGHVGRSISFYDHNEDSSLAPKLVETLRTADKEIPAFLIQSVEEVEEGSAIDESNVNISVTIEEENVDENAEDEWQ